MAVLVVLWTCVMFFTVLSVVESQENGDLRLSDGSIEGGITSGRVEIYLNKIWGTLDAGTSENEMITRTGRTACRQLGFDSEAFAGTVSYLNISPANNSVPMLLDNVQCQDRSLHILRCNYHNISQPATPNHSKDFAVGCNVVDPSVHPYNTQVRLVQGGTGYASSGYLEIFLGGSWGPTCYIGVNGAYTACRQLGYTEIASFENGLTYHGDGEDKVDLFHCTIIDNYSCLKYCITASHECPVCSFGHDVLNCTFIISHANQYTSGGEDICSSSSSQVALAVGLVVGLLLIAIMVVCLVVCCCCCIPGCIVFNTRKRLVEYKEI